MPRDRNDGSDYEARYFPDPVKQRDPDEDMEAERDFYAELEKDLSAQRRTEIARPSIEYVESIKREQFDIADAKQFNKVFSEVV